MSASARSVVAGSGPPRVLLVHANPFQRVTPVPAYGLERLRTAIEPSGAEVELLDPYLVSEDPLGTARAAAERFRPDVIGLGIRIIDDCIVIDRLEAPDDEPIDVSFLLPEILELRRALAEAAPQATFVAGGAGFSACPQECLEFLGVDYGVVGAGEDALIAVCAGQSLDGIPGVIRRGQPEGIAAYRLTFGGPTRRDPLYAPVNSFPVRTRIGCAMQCVYCTAANLGRQHANGDLGTVLDEVEQTVAAARERGVGRVSIFFADDEFNLPDERHPISILEGIRDRGLEKHLTWRAYFNPTPFSAQFAELVRETNGHVSITVDSAADGLLETAQKPFRRRHLDDLVALLSEHGVSADLGLIFGLPGETEETIAETIAFVRALPPSIEVVYSAGARVYPHTPLSRIAAQEPERLVGADDPSFLTPVVYSRPWPPRELARHVDRQLASLPNVSRVGAAYRSGQTTLADAYRTVLAEPTLQQTVAKSNGKGRWAEILERAARDDSQRKPAETIAACLQVALWHSRYDLASTAAARLLQEDTPAEMSRAQLRFARYAYGGLAWADRAKAALRR
ncbi:MAG TPA: cobalamin-dependent protein [Gaiellaceae bacterium]|nr:cobalamin-dependent protein [Gaiellaceae bacterium]